MRIFGGKRTPVPKFGSRAPGVTGDRLGPGLRRLDQQDQAHSDHGAARQGGDDALEALPHGMAMYDTPSQADRPNRSYPGGNEGHRHANSECRHQADAKPGVALAEGP